MGAETPGEGNARSNHDGSWWKAFLTALAALAGAAIAWGWLSPGPVETPASVTDTGIPDVPPEAETTGSFAAASVSSDEIVVDRRAPAWVRPTILWTLGIVIAVVVVFGLLGLLRDVITYLVLALFFSFALEPAVNYMHAHWRWRRGIATALLLGVVMLLMIVLILIFVPTLLQGASLIADRLSESAGDLSEWASDTLGVNLATDSIESGTADAASSLQASSRTPMSAIFGFTASLIGGIFGAFTVGMFVFYMVAEAQRFKRSVLGFFPRRRQEELLSIWEAAIEKTGGYFYSRLLLATINGGLFYVMLRVVGVPGAAALAFFEGSVAAFIPIVGTYVAAIVPLVVAFTTVGAAGALVLLIYVLIYQQVENYLISPKIQGKTMQIHPAVAFGAALAGGAIGGLLWAFLALPFAATVQASASLWFQHHEVVESALTRVEPAPPKKEREDASLVVRGRSWLAKKRGWIRREV